VSVTDVGQADGVPGREPVTVGIAVIRAMVESGPHPVIRILEVSDLFGEEHVLSVTTSADEAAKIIRDWLRKMIQPKGN
jgi:hypothetical protein